MITLPYKKKEVYGWVKILDWVDDPHKMDLHTLQSRLQDAQDLGAIEVFINRDSEGSLITNVEARYTRLETDEELEERKKRNQMKKEREQTTKERGEQLDRQEYERLKKKFEGSDSNE